MVVAGYQGSNPSRNINRAEKQRLFYRPSGGQWINLGSLVDVNMNPEQDFLEAFTNHDGGPILARRISNRRSFNISATLQEVNSANLQVALSGGAFSQATINIPSTAVVTRSTATGSFTLPEAAIGNILEVRSEDGETLYAETTDYTYTSPSPLVAVVASSSLDTDVPAGSDAHFLYEVPMTDAQTMDVFGVGEVTGEFQLQILEGGIQQVITIGSGAISANGNITVASEDFQTIPIVITSQATSGALAQLTVL